MSCVAGNYNTALPAAAGSKEEATADGDEDVGGLFRVVNRKQQEQREMRDTQDGLDCARFAQPQTRDWAEVDVS